MHGGSYGGNSGGNIGCAHQFGNQRAAFCAVAGYFRDVVFLDAADGDEGQIDMGDNPVQIFQRDRSADIFLCLGGENGADADVVRADGDGGPGLIRGMPDNGGSTISSGRIRRLISE